MSTRDAFPSGEIEELRHRAETAEALVERFRSILGRAAKVYPCRHCAGTGGGAAMGWTSLCARCMGSAVELHPPLTPISTSMEAQS